MRRTDDYLQQEESRVNGEKDSDSVGFRKAHGDGSCGRGKSAQLMERKPSGGGDGVDQVMLYTIASLKIWS